MTQSLYDVTPGVDWVNGTAVSEDRVVHLTEAEAAFDLSLARISLHAPAKVEAAGEVRVKPRVAQGGGAP